MNRGSVAILSVSALVVLACGDDGRPADSTASSAPGTSTATTPTGTTDGDASSSTAPTSSDATSTPTTTTGSTDSGPLFDLGQGLDVAKALQCSADLHAVVDMSGQVVEPCAADQGCADAQCVPACDAAAASKANFGCDFQVPTPPTSPYLPTPPCFAAFLTNSWGHPAKIEVTRDGVAFDLGAFARVVTPGQAPEDWSPVAPTGLGPGEVAVLFLSSHPNSIHPETMVNLNCPVPDAAGAATQVDASGRGLNFHVTSDIPLTAYDMAPFGGAFSYIPSAELLFPTSAWGTNYVAVMPPVGTHVPPGPLWLQVVGAADGTNVEIRPTADLEAGPDIEAAPAGMVKAFTVDAGEYVQWEVAAGAGDASGTLILSDKPVALHTGNRFLRLQPMPVPGGEATHQQNHSVTALGYEYVAAAYETRRADLAPEAIEYRVVGAVDGTTLTYDPPVPGAPAALAQGQVVEFAATGSFQIRSQDPEHPFVLSQIMDTCDMPGGTRPGATAPGFNQLLGDEEWVILLPPAQFLQEYIFFTDPSYATTNLVITRVDDGDGFHDVTVDCLGTVSGWQPVGGDARFEVATVDLIRADVGVNGCTNGQQTAKSDGKFGLVVWGLDSYSSYAYPAGGNAIALTDLVIPPG
ncbi:IgGFc-binding protein [Nannocystis radixulma]|uniref:IgGFc-binding protein n=1 Tax=Nannocystis radixulma TaxID=2995305 RepID=A0ABT5B205_9BACT|nr:IgGFc-binding protein [Nannocystis radixulma]MDC0668131.1 IgGFc-binding protein [Nannocystis radixulma]